MLRDLFYDILSHYEYDYAKVPRLNYSSTSPDTMVDVLYGQIELNKHVCYLLSFPIIDRLRDIKQLALTDLVYTGATHTRMEHSLGVSHLLTRLPKDVSEQDRAILSVIGLLHDIGHSGWGHALDGITSKVVSEISEMAGREIPLFLPRKLDMAVTSYLLYNNDQLMSALEKIAKSLTVWRNVPLETHPRRLRDFIAWIVSEEESGHLRYCEEWLDSANQLKSLACYFQNLLGFEVNADRLDWMERDAHHAFRSVDLGHLETVDALGLVKRRLQVAQDKNDISKVEIEEKATWDQLKKAQSDVRELLYGIVYEGVERSFIDSLLTRLVYSSILVLSTIGNQIASPSSKARVIMGYIFSPDAKLRDYTEKILSSYHSRIQNMQVSSDKFVRNSYSLWSSLFENLRLVRSLLIRKNTIKSKMLTSVKIAGEIRINHDKFTIMYLDGIWLSGILGSIETLMKSARGGASLNIVWHALNEYLTHLRTDTISVFQTEKIEEKINEAEEIRNRFRVYVLPNYYFLRRLIDKMPEFIKNYSGQDSIIIAFIEHLQERYSELPLVFIVTKGDVSGIEESSIKHIEDMLTHHLAGLFGEKLGFY